MPKQKPTLVLRGSFNPAIIQPRWLADQGIINALSETGNSGGQVDLELQMHGFRGNTSKELHFETEGVKWTVSETRVILDPGLAREAAPRLLKGVLDKLRHTPISGVGHNLSTTFAREEWKNSLPHLEESVERHLTSLGTIASQVHVVSIAGEDNMLYNISIRDDVTELIVDINMHHEVDSIETALEIIGQFTDDLDRADKIAHGIAEGDRS